MWASPQTSLPRNKGPHGALARLPVSIAFVTLCFLSSALFAAADRSDYYLEFQTDCGLSRDWWGGSYANSQYFGLSGNRNVGLGPSLEGGLELGGHWRMGLFLEEDESSSNGSLDQYVAFHKAGFSGGYFYPFLGFLRLGADLGLGGFLQSEQVFQGPGGTVNYWGQLAQADARLQADLVDGIYLDLVLALQSLDATISPQASSLLNKTSLRLGLGWRF